MFSVPAVPAAPAMISPGSPIQCTLPKRTMAPADQRSTKGSQPSYQSHSKPLIKASSGAICAASLRASSKARRCAGKSPSTTCTSQLASMLAGRVRWSVETMTRHPAAAAARTFSSNVAWPSENEVWVWQSTSGHAGMATPLHLVNPLHCNGAAPDATSALGPKSTGKVGCVRGSPRSIGPASKHVRQPPKPTKNDLFGG